MSSKPEDDHWLARPETVRKLWIALIVVLALEVLAGLVVPPESHFAIDGLLGFGAWYGFASCVALVVIAKTLSVFVKRPDTFYDD